MNPDASRMLSSAHVFRVGRLASFLAAELGEDDDNCFLIETAARLHDLGRIALPAPLMAQRSALKPEHARLLRVHAEIGAELLLMTGQPSKHIAIAVARHHHEAWDE
jgi:response regulator RpfG family c-di-GMP phosphodiesterase